MSLLNIMEVEQSTNNHRDGGDIEINLDDFDIGLSNPKKPVTNHQSLQQSDDEMIPAAPTVKE